MNISRICLIFSIFLSITSWAQALDGSNLRISLLTCSKGDDIASDFGHSAIRVTDTVSGRDVVFNYGTYDFEAPHFVLKFMRGRMDYMLSACYYEDFIRSYVLDNRAVSERELLLEPDDRLKVCNVLVNAWQGPGRRYRYDYFRNNCATRIRDIFIGPKSVVPELSVPEHEPSYTYRTAYGELYLYDVPWLMFGLDLLMGSLLDRPINFTEEMYLPCLLEQNLSQCSFAGSGAPLLGESVTLVENEPRARGWWSRITAPVPVFYLIFVLFSVGMILLHESGYMRAVRVITRIMHAIIGMTGALIAFMWFGTEHYWTGANWNLLWMNPLFLIPASLPESRVRRWFVYVLSVTALLTAACKGFIPQNLNDVLIPMSLMHIFMWGYTMIDSSPAALEKCGKG